MKRNLRNHLQIRMLRAIVAIEAQQSLLKASVALGITQPALTRTLREVEVILGDRIFERHSRGVRLTPFGRVACDAARRILAEIDRLDEDMHRFATGEAPVVTIGAMAPAAIGLLPAFLAYLRTAAPDANVSVIQGTMEELIPLLIAGEISGLVGRLYPQADERFAHEILYDEPISILARASHPIFQAGRVTAATLARYDFVLPGMSLQVEQEFEALLARMGIFGTARVRPSSLPFLRELLHSSDDLTISPPQTMGGDIDRGTIRVVPFDIPGPPRPAGLTFRRDHKPSKDEQRVIELLRKYLHRAPATAAAASVRQPA